MKIFHKVFLSHLAVALAALFITSAYTGWRMLNGMRQVMMQELEVFGREAAELLKDRDWESPDMQVLQSTFNAMERRQEAHVWLVDRQGLIRMASTLAETEEPSGHQFPTDAWNRVLQGEVVNVMYRPEESERTDGTDDTDRPRRPGGPGGPGVAVPVYRQGEVEGAVILTPLLRSPRWRGADALPFLFYGALIAASAVALMSWVVAKSIARPIELVGEAGKKIGRGDFSARVDWSSKDELGGLAQGFNEMAAELDRLETGRKELMAHVSHELKGPLARISGYIEAINDGIGGEEARRSHFDIVRQEVGRLTRLVNDLLDVSRLEAGRLKLHPIPCDLAPYLGRAAAVFDGPAQEGQVTLEMQIPSILPIVLCEPERVEQVLVNLLQNALAHTPPGGRIQVFAQVEGSNLAVTVTDTGSGIAPDELPEIWNQFHKANRARTLDKSGSGLGLTIVKQLIELQGGQVWVESTLGEGSRFGFKLPLATPET